MAEILRYEHVDIAYNGKVVVQDVSFTLDDGEILGIVGESGSGTVKILAKHILPNIVGPILVTAMLDIGTMMMELAGLSFLGLGAKPPIAEWGSMMSENRALMTTVPWITMAPGLAIFVSVMIFNLLGDTVRDYADPKARGR